MNPKYPGWLAEQLIKWVGADRALRHVEETTYTTPVCDRAFEKHESVEVRKLAACQCPMAL